jgi:hypothetical protein
MAGGVPIAREVAEHEFESQLEISPFFFFFGASLEANDERGSRLRLTVRYQPPPPNIVR